MHPPVIVMHEISIIKLNKADKPYQLLMLKNEQSVQLFKIQLDKNLVLDKELTKFDNPDEMIAVLKQKLGLKGTLPNEIESWCQENEILKKTKPEKPEPED